MRDEDYKMYYHEFFIPMFKHFRSLGYASSHWDTLRAMDKMTVDALYAKIRSADDDLCWLKGLRNPSKENCKRFNDRIEECQEKIDRLMEQRNGLLEKIEGYE